MTATSRSLSFTLKSATVRSSSGRFLRELLANERLPQDELQARQDHAARAIAEHAMQESPFYRRLYGERGIDPRILDDPRRWAELPILDRATVKAHSGEFATPEAVGRSVRTALTGGSTGEPLRTLHDARVPSLALAWRMYSWWGIQPYDDLARIGRWSFGRMDAVKNTIAWWPTRQLSLDAAVISEETMTEFHRAVTRVRPRLLEGYVGALLELADFLERRGLRIPAPTAVATTAAPLTAPVRARLEDAFEAPVHDEYRGSEFGWMAGECDRQDGLHIFSDVRRIEVVDADGRPAPPGRRATSSSRTCAIASSRCSATATGTAGYSASGRAPAVVRSRSWSRRRGGRSTSSTSPAALRSPTGSPRCSARIPSPSDCSRSISRPTPR